MPPARGQSPPFIRFLGLALRAERERKGWTQEELCHKAGLDRTYLSGVERGERSPNLRTLIRLATALDSKLSKLIAAAEAAQGAQR